LIKSVKKKEKAIVEKEAIIAEYLVGNTTYRKLDIKYGIDFRIIHSWVMKYQGKHPAIGLIAISWL
jgi:transposase-like protein